MEHTPRACAGGLRDQLRNQTCSSSLLLPHSPGPKNQVLTILLLKISQLSILLSNFYYHCSGFCHHHLSPGSATLLLNGFPSSLPRTLPKISRHFISLLISEFYCGDLIKPLTFRFCPSLALANGTLQPCLLYVKDL